MADEAVDRVQMDGRYEDFLKVFVPVQLRLIVYVRMLVHNRADADDVFQETSLVLWRRFSEYDSNSDFFQWAAGISRRQVLKSWRETKRGRQLLSDSAFERLSSEAVGIAQETNRRQAALELCLRTLTGRQRDLLRAFYDERLSAQAIASTWDRTVHAVYKNLKTVRRKLYECVEQRLKAET